MDADFALLEAEDAAVAPKKPLVVSAHPYPAQRLCSLPSCSGAGRLLPPPLPPSTSSPLSMHRC